MKTVAAWVMCLLLLLTLSTAFAWTQEGIATSDNTIVWRGHILTPVLLSQSIGTIPISPLPAFGSIVLVRFHVKGDLITVQEAVSCEAGEIELIDFYGDSHAMLDWTEADGTHTRIQLSENGAVADVCFYVENVQSIIGAQIACADLRANLETVMDDTFSFLTGKTPEPTATPSPSPEPYCIAVPVSNCDRYVYISYVGLSRTGRTQVTVCGAAGESNLHLLPGSGTGAYVEAAIEVNGELLLWTDGEYYAIILYGFDSAPRAENAVRLDMDSASILSIEHWNAAE